MPRYKLTIEYDGSRYHGWQFQRESPTIMGALMTAIRDVYGDMPFELYGAGRTDAGVHALGQTASFRTVRDLPPSEVLSALRQYLPEDIGAVSAAYAPPRFHARLSAVEKTYRYRVWTTENPCVFERRFVYVLPGAYDLEAMQTAARQLEGRHDFRAFSAVKTKKTTVRTLSRVEIVRQGDELRFDYTADGFLHRMVRVLTGTLLEIGRGDRPAEAVTEILAGRLRAEAGFTVPARGLCLMEVRYK